MSNIKAPFKAFRKGFRSFGLSVSILVNFVLLFFVYLMGIGLTSIVAKIFHKHFLDLDNKNQKSYWTQLNLNKKKIDYYYKQF